MQNVDRFCLYFSSCILFFQSEKSKCSTGDWCHNNICWWCNESERESDLNSKEMSILKVMDCCHWQSTGRCDYSRLSWSHDKRKKKQEIDQTVSSKYRRITFPCFMAFRKLGRKPRVSGISHYLLFTATLTLSVSNKQACCFSSHKPHFASPSRPAFLPGPCY